MTKGELKGNGDKGINIIDKDGKKEKAVNKEKYGDSKVPSSKFLTWFIGFTEGDGSFVITKRNKEMQFVITQSTDDVDILHLIVEQLGFGKVIKQGKRTSRFIVQDLYNMHLLILLFNGNLVLPTRKKMFKTFLENKI